MDRGISGVWFVFGGIILAGAAVLVFWAAIRDKIQNQVPQVQKNIESINTVPASPENQPENTSVQDKNDIYTTLDNKLRFTLPKGWKISEEDTKGKAEGNRIVITYLEDQIELNWSRILGAGGACDKQYIKMTAKNMIFDVCLSGNISSFTRIDEGVFVGGALINKSMNDKQAERFLRDFISGIEILNTTQDTVPSKTK